MTIDENAVPSDNIDDKSAYLEECLQRHIAPIKLEYLVPRKPVSDKEASTDLDSSLLNQETSDKNSIDKEPLLVDHNEPENGRKRKACPRARGQNKERKGNLAVAISCRKQQLCRLLATGRECNREASCYFNHDVEEALRTRKAREAKAKLNDCPEGLKICPWRSRSATCPYGLNCQCFDEHLYEQIGHDGDSLPDQQNNGEFNSTRHVLNQVKKSRCNQNRTNDLLLEESEKDDGQNSLVESDTGLLMTEDTASSNSSQPDTMTIEEKCPFRRMQKSETDSVESRSEKLARLNKLLKGKIILAPLTTLGNLPFRRVCIKNGVEVTMSEMALAQSICALKSSELALLRRHEDEKIFGIQLAGGYPDKMSQAVDIMNKAGIAADWIDINMGCPLTPLNDKGAGCILMRREKHLQGIIEQMSERLNVPLTIKCRMAFTNKEEPTLHQLAPKLMDWGCSGITVHGRTAQQRYSNEARWDYTSLCQASIQDKGLFIGNGDLFDPQQITRLWRESNCDSMMIGRGALIKPWIFEEIKRGQLWDIRSSERFEILKTFCHYGLYHWGSDSKGVETTRRFLLEHLSFFHRYIPVGLLERTPQGMNDKPPLYFGRDDLETLMSKSDVTSWINLSEMLLGKVPEGFSFIPKHKSSSYEQQQ